MTSLIRGGPWAADFRPLWDKDLILKCERRQILHSLSVSVPGFRESCGDFVYDLRSLRLGDETSRTRLEATGHEFSLGLPYFDKDTAKKILKIPTMRGTLKDDLRALAQKRDCTECVFWGLAPIFEYLLKVQWDRENNRAIVEELPPEGLSLWRAKEKSGGLSSFAKEMARKGAGILKRMGCGAALVAGRGGRRDALG